MEYADILKLQLLGHNESADGLLDQLPDGFDGSDLVAAAFGVLVAKRFEEDSSADAIHRFVAQAQRNYPESSVLKPLAAEALIRTVLNPDEAHLLDEVDPANQVPIELLLSRKIVAESNDLQERIDDVMSDAITLAHYWSTLD